MTPEGIGIDHSASDQDPLKEQERGVDYVAYVESREFGNAKKTALDIARLLTDPTFTVTGKDRYGRNKMAVTREKAFNAFCHVCVTAGVEVPGLERDLYEPFLPADVDASHKRTEVLPSQTVIDHIESQIAEREPDTGTEDIRAIMRLLQLFPEELADKGYLSRIDRKQLLAVLNDRLVAAGLVPVRPDYASIRIALATGETEPTSPKKILIVDDDNGSILESSLRLAGWPGIDSSFHHYQRSQEYRMAPDVRQARVQALIDSIIEQAPDIVLMDEGLDGESIKGSDVVKLLRNDPRASTMLFVANTGGSDDDFRRAGAYPNFEKGLRPDGLRAAVMAG